MISLTITKSRLPDDIIYYMVFPFLVDNICNTSDFQIFRVNKRMYSTKPSCFSGPKSKFGNQVWCSVHTPHEYTFSQNIKSKIGSIRNLPYDDRDTSLLLNEKTLTYHNHDITYTPTKLLYYWKRVVDKSPYKIEHLCCSGTGVVFSLRINVSPETKKFILANKLQDAQKYF